MLTTQSISSVQNWGQSQDKIELEPLPKGLTRYPTRLKDVQTLVRTLHAQHYAPGAASETLKPHLRVVGHGHSWTPIFADQKGDWVIFCREFEFEDGTRIKNAGLAPDGAPLVKVGGYWRLSTAWFVDALSK